MLESSLSLRRSEESATRSPTNRLADRRREGKFRRSASRKGGFGCTSGKRVVVPSKRWLDATQIHFGPLAATAVERPVRQRGFAKGMAVLAASSRRTFSRHFGGKTMTPYHKPYFSKFWRENQDTLPQIFFICMPGHGEKRLRSGRN